MNIYLEGRTSGWKLHSLYDSLIDYPPKGVRFYHPEFERPSRDGTLLRAINGYISRVGPLKGIIDDLKPSIYYTYYKTTRRKSVNTDMDLIYSSQHLIFDRIPWVVDLEFVTGLVGYGNVRTYRRILERTFSSRFCKKIMPWTDAGKETIRLGLNCSKFDEKIETVHIAVPPRKFVKRFVDDGVRLLFVGTGNKFNLTKGFELKGGREMIPAFARLRRKYPGVSLTMRSLIPDRHQHLCISEG